MGLDYIAAAGATAKGLHSVGEQIFEMSMATETSQHVNTRIRVAIKGFKKWAKAWGLDGENWRPKLARLPDMDPGDEATIAFIIESFHEFMKPDSTHARVLARGSFPASKSDENILNLFGTLGWKFKWALYKGEEMYRHMINLESYIASLQELLPTNANLNGSAMIRYPDANEALESTDIQSDGAETKLEELKCISASVNAGIISENVRLIEEKYGSDPPSTRLLQKIADGRERYKLTLEASAGLKRVKLMDYNPKTHPTKHPKSLSGLCRYFDKLTFLDKGKEEKARSVAIEWMSYRKFTTHSAKYSLELRIQELIKILSRENFDGSIHPEWMLTLPALGYIDNPAQKCYGVVYDLEYFGEKPIPCSKKRPWVPTTLFDYISSANVPKARSQNPDFPTQLKLARDIVRTYSCLRANQWVHKKLGSQDILLFEKKENEGQPSTLVPRIIGFEHAQPALVAQKIPRQHRLCACHNCSELEELSTHLQIDPDYQLDPHPSYKPIYDIYSLAVVLVEIGSWTTVDALYRKNGGKEEFGRDGQTYQNFRKFLIKKSQNDLKPMGDDYQYVVEACLRKVFRVQNATSTPATEDTELTGIWSVLGQLELIIV